MKINMNNQHVQQPNDLRCLRQKGGGEELSDER